MLLLWIIYVISALFLLCFLCVCLLMPCGHLLGKGWPLGSRLWCLIVKLSLSHWYPGSGVVLDCIDSWSLLSFLLCVFLAALWSPAGKGLLLFIFYVCLWFAVLSDPCSLVFTFYVLRFHVFFSLSNVVSLVKCGIWLYRFLIFAFLLIFLVFLWYLAKVRKLQCELHNLCVFNNSRNNFV